MGPFGSDITTDNFVDNGVPVIRGVNLSSGRFHDSGFVYLTEQKADQLRGANALAGDLVFTHRGTLGQVALIPPSEIYARYVISQSQMKLSCDTSKVDPLFLYYYFRSPMGQHALLANISTTGVPAISRPLSSLKAIRVPWPPLQEQRAIAHILGTLDDKIELNRRMNATLEEMARALFRSWFVDFDPVRARVEGRQPEGMDAATAALFPDSFEETVLGEVPRGWRVGMLCEVAEITMGQSPPGDTYNEFGDGLPFYQGSRDFGFRFPTQRIYCTAPTRFAKRGDVLLSVRAPVGTINITPEDCAIGRGVAALRLRLQPASYLYYLLNATRASWARFNAEGTVFGSVTKANVHNFCTLIPPDLLIQRFGRIIDPNDERILSNSLEIVALSEIRDALLPKLLSGEIRVGEAERAVAG